MMFILNNDLKYMQIIYDIYFILMINNLWWLKFCDNFQWDS